MSCHKLNCCFCFGTQVRIILFVLAMVGKVNLMGKALKRLRSWADIPSQKDIDGLRRGMPTGEVLFWAIVTTSLYHKHSLAPASVNHRVSSLSSPFFVENHTQVYWCTSKSPIPTTCWGPGSLSTNMHPKTQIATHRLIVCCQSDTKKTTW